MCMKYKQVDIIILQSVCMFHILPLQNIFAILSGSTLERYLLLCPRVFLWGMMPRFCVISIAIILPWLPKSESWLLVLSACEKRQLWSNFLLPHQKLWIAMHFAISWYIWNWNLVPHNFLSHCTVIWIILQQYLNVMLLHIGLQTVPFRSWKSKLTFICHQHDKNWYCRDKLIKNRVFLIWYLGHGSR